MKILILLAYSFLKVGFFGFGGGFAMIPLMEHLAVKQNHWLTYSQFSAAIALGQVTPGPVSISATFIGYKVAGFWGALVATIAVFLPSLAVIYLLEIFYLKIRGNPLTQSIMHGVIPIIVALILNVAYSMGKSSVQSLWQFLIIVIVAILAMRKSLNYGVLIAGSILTGILFSVNW
ncbi:chromate transport protein ChrA [Desulfosporosinus acidiphilus SJ4]|uniref:Chromate transport protein ChrA n=1 Tax=Desulfosporosinus acidiphilus (strain DSM 22704 / JCM 16185 / SJ4) TaxID=646529 RepID=I4D789_DESAJ|nr:chromate transporter [Desulfosporosinus acidiphilus]AFM41663.1 chromate transport protein ChrA [Desulfosporosinus acidiphilus SJ4]